MSRPIGCLVWLIILLVLLIIAALMFGGFQKGTKYSSQSELGVHHALGHPGEAERLRREALVLVSIAGER